MRRSTRRRRGIAAAALGISMLFALSAPSASAGGGNEVKDWVCDYRWRHSTYQLKRLIRCAARRWTVAGGPDKALSVARCESHLDPRAYASGNAGVFQQAVAYWPTRAQTFGFPGVWAYNGRANAIVSVRMAHVNGWSAWSCA
jgi:hypothetical protein